MYISQPMLGCISVITQLPIILFILQIKQIFHYGYSNSNRAISVIFPEYSGSCSILFQIISVIKYYIKLSFKTVLKYQLFRNTGHSHITDILSGNGTTTIGYAAYLIRAIGLNQYTNIICTTII